MDHNCIFEWDTKSRNWRCTICKRTELLCEVCEERLGRPQMQPGDVDYCSATHRIEALGTTPTTWRLY